ncbi:Uu.00g020520.m01.CDS01 [Anthostomella pinea]|uniref:Uu.00g020520.m01.CDS01 n=1 Tax=Anthostomella pinea TaxID=933095 RepID=A0AAI8W0P9_9PEZI|nr:Uu.00g020520.m01.CDS01 [Anthostomella pinea]
MHPIALTLPSLALFAKSSAAQSTDTWGIWFFSDGCVKSTDGYSGTPGTQDETLTCMTAETQDADGKVVPGPYTNIVTSNFESLGMKATLWNDTGCTELIVTIDTDGCQVVPENNHILGFNIGPK